MSKKKRNMNEKNKNRKIENCVNPKKSSARVTLPKYIKERIG